VHNALAAVEVGSFTIRGGLVEGRPSFLIARQCSGGR
jgi:hypothetical protein